MTYKKRLTKVFSGRSVRIEASKPLNAKRTPHPLDLRFFCVWILPARNLAMSGRAVNTKPGRGINPPDLVQVSNLPLTSGSSKALCEWSLNAHYQGGF